MDETLFSKLATEVQRDFEMGGLAEGLYYDFALETAKRYIEVVARSPQKKSQLLSAIMMTAAKSHTLRWGMIKTASCGP